MKRLLSYQMAIINNHQMDVRSTPPSHYSNRLDKNWVAALLFQAVVPRGGTKRGEEATPNLRAISNPFSARSIEH